MAEYLDKAGLTYLWSKIKAKINENPKFYNVKFSQSGIITPDGFLSDGMKAELSTSTTTFEKGLYMITYDVFLFSVSDAGHMGEVFLTADDGSAQVNTSNTHKVVSPMFGDLAFGIILPYTDFIELSKPSKVNINIGNLAGNGVSACLGSNSSGEDYQPTVIKLR